MNFLTKLINNCKLNIEQKKINKLYEKNGLTDEVLERQISVNKKRNKMNIPDSQERIYKKWVQ